jgi:hypothetical protein
VRMKPGATTRQCREQMIAKFRGKTKLVWNWRIKR